MESPIKQYADDHLYLLNLVARTAGFEQPVALDLDEFYVPLVKAARRRELLPIEGVLVRDWDPDARHTNPGMQIGMRLFEIEGIRFVRVRFHHNGRVNCWRLDFVAGRTQGYT